MSSGLGVKRPRASAEDDEAPAAPLVHSKRMCGPGGAPWTPQLPTPPAAGACGPPPDAVAPMECEHRHGAEPMPMTPEHSPLHYAADEPEDEWEDALDPTNPYYEINRLLNRLHREREARRQRRRPLA
ncbi:hypothetical protein IWQ57_002541 [Coemansia nantahalensis]|uniref:Uncharacterized protein n=2 Tax=Coemansia TaxID=4863 RepID=A0ACC1LB15_9FUNG|nr:hypothetical protein IWQ57_002541 [Coemansia nantahalensis]KAJ2804567.1 hypothetical protein H4R21_001594 [Coemansia helicoidea]